MQKYEIRAAAEQER